MTFPFSKVVTVYEQLENVSSGNKMREILSVFFKIIPKEDLDKVVYLSTGSIASECEGINFGMAEKMVVKAISAATGKNEKELTTLFKKKGDLGLVAESIVGHAEGKLFVDEVFRILHEIAATSGAGSQEKKCVLLGTLLRKASPNEAKYIVRILLNKMRLGAGTMTILDSLSIAFTGTKANKPKLEHAYNICPDIGVIAHSLATKGLHGVEQISVMVGRPIKMMLASRIGQLKDINEKMPGTFAVEEKYDGERVQIHYDGKKIILYSRRLENITEQFPELVALAHKNLHAKSYVVEGEIVSVDQKGNLLPFQVLMQRRRKQDVEEYRKKVPVCLFLFDLLYLDGEQYLHKSYPERRSALKRITKKTENKFVLARQIVTDNIEETEEFFTSALAHGGEGIMVKSTALHSVYQTGTRGWLWIKWKKEYAQELSDTLDLVVVGAFMGRGRRSGSYGALLCAAYNDKKGVFETVCKLGSGFSDEQLVEFPGRFNKYVASHKPTRLVVHKSMQPDVWFDPVIIVEVLGAELTRSPVHTCCEEGGQGLALRFPRFLRYREDKSPEQVTTSKEIWQMYKEKVKRR